MISTHRRSGAHGSRFVLTPEIDWTNIPRNFWGGVSAICRTYSDCLDLNLWFGDPNFEPDLPVLLIIPNPVKPFGQPFYGQVCGMGEAPVYEIRDEAVARWEITQQRLRKNGSVVNFDELRDKAGYSRHEDIETNMQESAWAAIQGHKASPVTNPVVDPKYPRIYGKTVHSTPDRQDWKAAND